MFSLFDWEAPDNIGKVSNLLRAKLAQAGFHSIYELWEVTTLKFINLLD